MIMGAYEPWWLNGITPEDEMARVTVELGVIGLLLNFFLRCLIAAFALRCAMSFRDPAYRALGIVLAVYLALGILVAIINNATAGLYYWGALGLVLTMRQLEQFARTKAGTTLAASRPRIDRLSVHAGSSASFPTP
jgi:hypothetical protein